MQEMRRAIARGNIVRTAYPGEAAAADDYVNLYLGSGRFGGSFDACGAMGRSYSHWARRQDNTGANTVFMHADHWSEGNHGLHYHLPVARLMWADRLRVRPDGYRQELDLFAGRLNTRLATDTAEIGLTARYHPYDRDLFALEIDYASHEGGAGIPALRLLPESSVKTQYDNDFRGNLHAVELNAAERTWAGRLTIGTADTSIYVRVLSEEGAVTLSDSDDGLTLGFDGDRGRHLLLIGVAGFERSGEMIAAARAVRDRAEYAGQAEEAWRKRWGDAWVEVPDDGLQAIWSRSVYYLLSSYSPDAECVGPAMGWSGNSWNYHFPQDFSYIVPALLRLGHVDIAKAKVEFYRSCLESTIRNTRRIYGTDGAMWSWEHPSGSDFDILEGEFVNWYQYEIHNAAYPARIAYETSLHVRDETWTRMVAWPIVEQSTRFYGSALRRDEHGKWNLKLEPSMGQDEMGGHNATNYLCALFSAKYCLMTALRMAEALGLESEELTRWRTILVEGLAFAKLYDADKRMYYTCEEALHSEMQQKHPVQLNPLVFLPLEELDDATATAYRRRYELCSGVNDRISHGWTLGAYWLAASHMRDGNALLRELKQIAPLDYADREGIQFYESSGAYMNQYYTTTHGLYAQAVNDAFVSDYWGRPEIGAACPEEWTQARFRKLRTKSGETISGEKNGRGWTVRMDA